MNNKDAMTRLLSLDVFRGLTIAVMILVNSPGNQYSYSGLLHSVWNGCTLADLVFPFFIVILGMSSVLTLTHLKQKGISNTALFRLILKRSVYIFATGLLLNMLPDHFDLSHLRILGVLQRVAICYFFASILFLSTRISVQVIIIAILLFGYWFLILALSGINAISMNDNLVSYIDRLILSPQHLYTQEFDPEGLLSTLPAIASALFGNVMGFILVSSWTKQQQLRWMMTAGILLSVLGLLWNTMFPINKLLWSSSYVLWTTGLSCVVFGICFALIEIYHWVDWTKPFLLFGKNAMLVYILHVLFLKIQAVILVHQTNGTMVDLRVYITDLLFGYLSPKNASLCYAVGYTLFWLFVLTCITEWRGKAALGRDCSAIANTPP